MTRKLSNDLYKRYQASIRIVEMAGDVSEGSEAQYWWQLWVIRRDELWKAEHKYFTDWLGWFTKQEWGDSQGEYYNKMGLIENLKAVGLTSSAIKSLLGKRAKTALTVDLGRLFTKRGGQRGVKPEVFQQIESGGETPKQFVKRVAGLAPGEARATVLGLVDKFKAFFHRDAFYDPQRRVILANLQAEHEEKGILGKWTVAIKLTNTETGEVEMPDEVKEWLARKMGIVFRSE